MGKFAERLKELRIDKGLTCMELGKAIGVSDASIVRWENKQADIKSEYLILLAKFFQVTTDYLLGLED
jgi:transcriptional regulator with XRE-family HTH domain